MRLSNEFLTTRSCNVSAVVAVDAELEESSVDDVGRTEDVIVSQWREVAVDERNQLRDQFDEILRPLGLKTKLVVVEKSNMAADKPEISRPIYQRIDVIVFH